MKLNRKKFAAALVLTSALMLPTQAMAQGYLPTEEQENEAITFYAGATAVGAVIITPFLIHEEREEKKDKTLKLK